MMKKLKITDSDNPLAPDSSILHNIELEMD